MLRHKCSHNLLQTPEIIKESLYPQGTLNEFSQSL